MLRFPVVFDGIYSKRLISTSSYLLKTSAGKTKPTLDRSQMMTYEMSQKPYHIGSRKAWLTWHTHNLEEFRKSQGSILAQDEVIRRFIHGFFPKYITMDGKEIVIKRRGNSIAVAGFLQYSNNLDIKKIYWMFGFTEEFLSILLKQPVTLEFQFVDDETELAYNYI
uniref:28S ribosomal protein S24, mitochondrial (inferred by orthology to a C. elegans protein) n=1 Tax=Strongyloides venezuelensis TaxID=75913 RepID=A0A0K0FAD5_STRVS